MTKQNMSTNISYYNNLDLVKFSRSTFTSEGVTKGYNDAVGVRIAYILKRFRYLPTWDCFCIAIFVLEMEKF